MTSELKHRPTFMRKIYLLACIAIFTFFAFNAQQSHAQKTPDEQRSILMVEELQPASGHKAPVNITMTTFTDGSIKVEGKGSIGLYDPQVVYTFDLEKKTYTVIENTDAPALNDENQRNLLKGGRVRVVVKDPVAIVLSQTMNELWWDVGADGKTVTFNRLAEWCNASNPSAGGTLWFTLSCDRNGAWRDSGNTRILNYSEGVYENWNWRYQDQGTWSQTSSTIMGRGGAGYDFTWSYQSWGESGALLHPAVYVN